MKPPPLIIHQPGTLEEALALLAEFGSDAKILAGGQSLVPMLNMRLLAPERLIDINEITTLAGAEVSAGGVRVGATVRHSQLEQNPDAGRVLPLLRQALEWVAHPTIRNRGTTVGSLAHADPSGELGAVLALLGGEVEVRSATRSRTVPAADFFTGPLESAIAPDELATSAWFPALPGLTGAAFHEVARRRGDYAVCGVAGTVTVNREGSVMAARAAYLSMAATPVAMDMTDAVAGQAHHIADWEAAARLAVDSLEPEDDIHASASYRHHLAVVLTQRVLREAASAAVTQLEAGAGLTLEKTP